MDDPSHDTPETPSSDTSTRRTKADDAATGRRTVLAASALLGAGALAAPATADGEGEDEEEEEDGSSDGGEDAGEPDAGDDGSGTSDARDLGLVTVERESEFEAVLDGITGAIEANDALSLVTTVDHAANAESVGLDLGPTTLVLFGNPNVGTPLMQAGRTAGIDLPQKLLVWCADGQVRVSYNDPAYLAERHGIEGQDERLSTVATLLERLATGGE